MGQHDGVFGRCWGVSAFSLFADEETGRTGRTVVFADGGVVVLDLSADVADTRILRAREAAAARELAADGTRAEGGERCASLGAFAHLGIARLGIWMLGREAVNGGCELSVGGLVLTNGADVIGWSLVLSGCAHAVM